MSTGKANVEKKEERQLSLFSNERSEDVASIIGAAAFILMVIVLV